MSPPLPTYHPPTPLPLEEGEMVYKKIATLSRSRLESYFLSLNHMKAKEIMDIFLPQVHEAVAKNKHTGELLRLSTVFLGYIQRSTTPPRDTPHTTSPVGGWEEGSGYNVKWQDKNSSYVFFESKEVLVALKDIIILGPEELKAELINDKNTGKKGLVGKT